MPERKKVMMQINELSNVDVSFISLVKNSANRSPFKILKSAGEDTMSIDLNKLFNVQKAESAPDAAIVAVIVKADVESAAIEQIGELGLTVVGKTETDGIVSLQLSEEECKDGTLLKLDDNAAVVVSGITKMFEDWSNSSNFLDNMTRSGFYPMLSIASDVMVSTIYNVMGTTAAGASPFVEVSAILRQFGDYVTKLVENVPVTAYKFEGLRAVDKAESDSEDVLGTKEEGAFGDGSSEKESGKVAKTDVNVEGIDQVLEDDSKKNVVAHIITEVLSGLNVGVEDRIKKSMEGPVAESVEAGKVLTEAVTVATARLDKIEDDFRGLVGMESEKDQVVKADEGSTAVFNDVLQFSGFDQ